MRWDDEDEPPCVFLLPKSLGALRVKRFASRCSCLWALQFDSLRSQCHKGVRRVGGGTSKRQSCCGVDDGFEYWNDAPRLFRIDINRRPSSLAAHPPPLRTVFPQLESANPLKKTLRFDFASLFQVPVKTLRNEFGRLYIPCKQQSTTAYFILGDVARHCARWTVFHQRVNASF